MTRRTPILEIVQSAPEPHAERLERDDDTPAIGSWWWVFMTKDVDEDDDGEEEATADGPPEDLIRDISAPKGRKLRWLGCITKTGSNFAIIEGYRKSVRIALDDFHQRCTPARDPAAYTKEKIAEHRGHVQAIMGEIREVCHRLGVPIHQVLGEGAPEIEDTGTALAVVHGVKDAKKHQRALEKLKEKTLPELFKKVEHHHETMSRWMRVEMIPSKSELERVKGVTDVLEAKIATVELYAGLAEEVVQVRKGKPAEDIAKVHLMQRRHYMDEECLARYEAGGMSFKHIGEFDKWIARDDNMFRLFPFPRTVIAFRIRHYDRRSDDNTVAGFISLNFENQENRKTFLYIRNGYQLWRVETSITFEEELFPNKEDNALLSGAELWIKPNAGSDDFIRSRRSIDAMHLEHQNRRRFAAYRLWQWHRAGCPDRKDPPWTYTVASGDMYDRESHSIRCGGWSSDRGNYKPVPPGGTVQITGRPSYDTGWDKSIGYRPLTPDDIYFDDAMTRIREVTTEHNRIAVIVQGLLDRSMCLHPHPPWRIWTPEGFAQGIELVYDVARAITAGEEMDFAAYRQQLNKSIRAGCYTLGQYKAWEGSMIERYGYKWREYRGYGDRGPARIARVVAVRRNGNCVFEWTRERMRPKWVRNPERPGYVKPTYPPIPRRWECPQSELTCIDAYTPGDYRMFFDDPRTREQYVRWAPILLSAENWHHNRRLAQEKAAEETAKAEAKRARKSKRKPGPTKASKGTGAGAAKVRNPVDLEAGESTDPLEGDHGYADAGGDE